MIILDPHGNPLPTKESSKDSSDIKMSEINLESMVILNEPEAESHSAPPPRSSRRKTRRRRSRRKNRNHHGKTLHRTSLWDKFSRSVTVLVMIYLLVGGVTWVWQQFNKPEEPVQANQNGQELLMELARQIKQNSIEERNTMNEQVRQLQSELAAITLMLNSHRERALTENNEELISQITDLTARNAELKLRLKRLEEDFDKVCETFSKDSMALLEKIVPVLIEVDMLVKRMSRKAHNPIQPVKAWFTGSSEAEKSRALLRKIEFIIRAYLERQDLPAQDLRLEDGGLRPLPQT